MAAQGLRDRVDEQHRVVIDDLRAGSLDAEIAAAEEQAIRAGGIQVQLLNPTSWLADGTVLLDVEIERGKRTGTRRKGRKWKPRLRALQKRFGMRR